MIWNKTLFMTSAYIKQLISKWLLIILKDKEEVCMSHQGFILVASIILCKYIWIWNKTTSGLFSIEGGPF